MAIQYDNIVQTEADDAFTQQLKEIQQHFAQKGNFIFGDTYLEVYSDQELYEEYRDLLLEGLDDGTSRVVEKLMDNSRYEAITEQSMSAGITPVTSLTLPMLRKTWPRLAITHAIPVQPVEKPKFTFMWLQPWIRVEPKGPKLALPEALMPESDSDQKDSDLVYSGALGASGNKPAMLPVCKQTERFTWRRVSGYANANSGANSDDAFNGSDDAAAGEFKYEDIETLAKGVDQTRTVKLDSSSQSATFNVYDNVVTWTGTESQLSTKQKGFAEKYSSAKDVRYNGLDVDIRISGVYMQCFRRLDSGAGDPLADKSMVVKIEHAARDTVTTHRPTTSVGDPDVLSGGASGVTAAYEGYTPMNVGEDHQRTGDNAYRTRGATPLRDVALMDTRTGVIGPIRVAGLNDAGGYDDDGDDGDGTQAKNSAVSEMNLFVHVNRDTGEVMVHATVAKHPGSDTAGAPKILGVEFEMYMNQQLNENVVDVGFDTQDRNVDIPTAQHLAAPYPEEYMTDMLRMFDINGVSKAVDLIADVISQNADMEGLEFMSPGVFAHAKLRNENTDPSWSKVPGAWVRTFDCRQSSVFTGSPVDWLATLRGVIDNLAQRIMNDVKFNRGYFVLLGNPIDTALLRASGWTFSDDIADEMGGVPIDYRVTRAVGGAYPYHIVAAPNEPIRNIPVDDLWGDNDTRLAQAGVPNAQAGGILNQKYSPRVTGFMRLFFIPTEADKVSYRMFPYSFTVANNNEYRHPDAPNVRAVVAHRRYVFDAFTKTMGIINILNNDGTYTQ